LSTDLFKASCSAVQIHHFIFPDCTDVRRPLSIMHSRLSILHPACGITSPEIVPSSAVYGFASSTFLRHFAQFTLRHFSLDFFWKNQYEWKDPYP